MNTRRWLATILVLLVAIGVLMWSVGQLRHDEQERTSAEQTVTSAPAPEPSSSSRASDVLTAPTATPSEPVPEQRNSTPLSAPGTVGTVTELPRPTAASSFKPLPKGESADVERQLDQVNLMLRDFRTIAGTNPVGTNAEIMKAIMGDNPRKATLGPPEGQTLNGKGELIDPWGTPYFFHQLSGTEMEIRSAGPDGEMWNQDDQTMTSATSAVRAR